MTENSTRSFGQRSCIVPATLRRGYRGEARAQVSTEVGYGAHGHRWGFRFFLGTLEDIDRERREIVIAPMQDDDGSELLARQRISYDYLVMAIGSVSNDFATPGVRSHCVFLDQREDAEQFRQRLLNHCLRVSRTQATSATEANPYLALSAHHHCLLNAVIAGKVLSCRFKSPSEVSPRMSATNSRRARGVATPVHAGIPSLRVWNESPRGPPLTRGCKEFEAARRRREPVCDRRAFCAPRDADRT